MTNYEKLLNNIKKAVDDFNYNPSLYAQKPEMSVVMNILDDINNCINNNLDSINESDCIVFDTSGIGDVIHSRLIVQNLKKNYNKISWLVPAITKPLYKDDNFANVLACCYLPYRNAHGPVEKQIVKIFNYIFTTKFPNKKIVNIPLNILLYLSKNQFNVTYPQLWFNSCGMNRDKNIKHELTHNGKLSDLGLNINKYLVIEYCCSSKPPLNVNILKNFIDRIKQKNIDCVYVGANTDPKIENGIDCRGYSLYDTFTLVKNSIGMLGRASGNECLCAFYPHIPIFEIEPQATMGDGEYINKSLVYMYNENNYIDNIVRYYS